MDTDSLIADLVALAGQVETLERTDPAGKAQAALEVVQACQRVTSQAAALRDEATDTLIRAGASLAEVGAALGVSKRRAHQLAKRGHHRTWGERIIPTVKDLRGAFADYCQSELERAEQACKGYLVSRAGENRSVDGRGFYAAFGRRLHPKWASDELLEHWETFGRPMTWTVWRTASQQG